MEPPSTLALEPFPACISIIAVTSKTYATISEKMVSWKLLSLFRLRLERVCGIREEASVISELLSTLVEVLENLKDWL